MKQLTVYLICFLLFAPFIFSQTASIKGVITDTTDKRNLANSVISVLRKSDSVLVSFTRSNAKGEFIVKKLKPGDYIVWITYPKFADYVDNLTVADSAVFLGNIVLTPKSELLKEVIVRQRMGAVRIKGDTLSFMADSFAVKEGATVEDLLKKLPGLQVNKNGEITAQGEKVQKVLVDGEEFFSDDPAVVTQNLRADAVKEVQVFDKKSDQATFTGIDDGEKTKTINLKLKDDKKRGVFGKVSVGGGFPANYSNEGMLNAFRGKRKIAAFGIMSNTGRIGLNWQDAEKYGAGSNMQFNEEEGYFYSFSNSEDEFGGGWGGSYYGQGLPTAWTGGLHFSNKWSEDKFHLNGNYRFNKNNVFANGSMITQYILPDTQYFNNQRQNVYKQNLRHQLIGSYEITLDTTSSIKITVNGSNTFSKNLSRFYSEALTGKGSPVNTSNRFVTSEADKQLFTSSLLWRKKFKKKGRTISLNFDQNYANNEFDGFLQSLNQFYNSVGDVFDIDSVDQKKENKNTIFSLNSRVAYTEPLSKTTFLELNYSYRVSNSEALRSSFDKSTNGKYEILNPVFSNDYAFRINTNMGGLTLRVNKKNFNYSLGGNISRANFKQTDLIKDSLHTYSYTNLFPRANFRYNLGPQKRISFNYNGNTRQPTLEQLQPIRENTDPLNIQRGNPDLKQEFRHNISLNFNDYKILTSRNIYVSANVNLIDNAISNSSTVDSLGRRTTQFVNVDGNYSLSGWSGYWMQIKKWDLHVGLNMDFNFSRNNNFVNGLKNTNHNKSTFVGLHLNHSKEKKYSFGINPRVGYNHSRSSIRPDVVTRYWSSDSEIDLNIELPWKLQFNTDVTFNLREKTDVFDRNNNTVRWNGWLAKKFWKNNTGEIRFSIFDILDQNIGFNRTATSNFITENTYDTFRRYWLLSFTWNFTKNPAAATPATN